MMGDAVARELARAGRGALAPPTCSTAATISIMIHVQPVHQQKADTLAFPMVTKSTEHRVSYASHLTVFVTFNMAFIR